MLNFPVPYPDELLYSTIARAGVHMGIVSPKQLLDDVFNDRHVIATVDLPNRLENIAGHLSQSLGFSAERLAYEHTLFPLYAPFTTEARRKHCLTWMASNSKKAIHLTLGLAASRIKQGRFIRYCPGCLNQILDSYGEYYWARRWQVDGANCCLEHGALVTSSLKRHPYHRHWFAPASPVECFAVEQEKPSKESALVARQAECLLNEQPTPSARYSQWSLYYKRLAQNAECNRGQHVNYDEIKERVLRRWPMRWLKQHGLAINDEQSCWLHSIFRKHRKSFSYLEHIVILESFLPEQWSIGDVLSEVRSVQEQADRPRVGLSKDSISETVLLEHRQNWLRLVEQHGTKIARGDGGGSLYAWLYRHDRDWLLRINKKHKLSIVSIQQRIDWHIRDVAVARKLIQIRNEQKGRLSSPRWSRNWYLAQLDQNSTVEKNLKRLPATKMFFKKYCEKIESYQMRRITNALSTLKAKGEDNSRWKILRLSGLSEGRLTKNVKHMLRGFC